MTTFVRLLEVDSDRKGEVLSSSAERWRAGERPDGVFAVDPTSFEQVPGSPFAYWVDETIRGTFSRWPLLGDQATIASGTGTLDDFRFLRAWWEISGVPHSDVWYPFAKGGEHAPYFNDLPLVVKWVDDGREMKASIIEAYGGGHWARNIRSTHLYLLPGLTWSRRSQRGLSVRCLPAGSIFGDKGPSVTWSPHDDHSALAVLAICNSIAFRHLVQLQMAFGSFEVGVLQRTPVPTPLPLRLSTLSSAAWREKRRRYAATPSSHAFTVPSLMEASGETIASRVRAHNANASACTARLDTIQAEIDSITLQTYCIEVNEHGSIDSTFGGLPPNAMESGDGGDEEDGNVPVEGESSHSLVEGLLEWTLGITLGRFDIRLATGQRQPPPDPDPFDPLPVCSPGMLQDDSGLPVWEAPPGYPLDLPPHGILVDDPGHPWDVVARMEAVLALVAGDRAHAWMQEIEEILGLELRDWLRRFGFERHLKRYSRSRRKAPLFWHLAPKSREYGLWLYSPVATRDTMYRILNDCLDPKLRSAERRLVELRQEAGASPTSQQRRELAGQESLVGELRAFRDEVARVAPLWAPFRDDGVVLNCAVLHRLFDHHRAWQKECEAKWKELAKGKYDWAGWAMHLWPERVVKSCASDRSIAIAHGVEEDLWEEDEQGKWHPRKDGRAQVARLTEERTSPALQAALDALNRAG